MDQKTPWVERFPGLSRLPAPLKQQLMQHSKAMDFQPNQVVFGPHHWPEHWLFLLSGSLKVQQTSDEGREIVLYRLRAGESCVISSACLLAFGHSQSAEGITETHVTAAAVPRTAFDQLVASSAEFRQFIFTAFSKRMTDLFLMVEELAFHRVDARLAQVLLQLSDEKNRVAATHQQLATELGTAREVISRQLQAWENQQWLSKSRGKIQLQQPEKLRLLLNSLR